MNGIEGTQHPRPHIRLRTFRFVDRDFYGNPSFMSSLQIRSCQTIFFPFKYFRSVIQPLYTCISVYLDVAAYLDVFLELVTFHGEKNLSVS